MSQSKVQHIFRVFDALNVVKGIKAVGGPDHQTYYIESDVYAPDRRITPLILQPYVEVSDPNGVIPSGDKVGELSSASWYVGEAILANKITAKESEATLDTPFAIGENNALHVRKNSTKSILLIFEGEYLDIRKDKNIHISLTYTLTTTSNTEVKPAPKLMLSKPQSWKYCPLENQTKAVIEATVSQDSKLYQSAVQWVKVEDDKEILIGENDPFYIEGQNTDKLTINPSLMGSTLVRAKNHDEVFYNQVYGINPEWDHRMDEVMRNRNLFILNGLVYQKYSGYDFIGMYIYGKKGVKYTASSNVPAMSGQSNLYFNGTQTQVNGVFIDHPITIEGNDEDIFIGITKDRTYTQDLLSGKYWIKLEEGSIPTSYTPAPEDLNRKNYIKNDFRIAGGGSLEEYQPYIYKYYVPAEADYPKAYSHYGLNKVLEKGKKYTLSLWTKTDRVGYNISIALADLNNLNLENSFKILYKEGWQFSSFVFTYKGIMSDIGVLRINALHKDINNLTIWFKKVKIEQGELSTEFTPAPEDLASDGILKGTYQSDIKFTRYFPKLETEIDFLTGDTLRAGMDTVKMKAVFKTNKEEIKNPEEYFDIKWYLDPVEAGGQAEYLGKGEFLEVPISKIPPKARAIPFRLEYEFK